MQFPFYSSAIFKKHKEKDRPYEFLNQKASLHQISLLPQLRAQCIVLVITMTFLNFYFLRLLPLNSLPPNCPSYNDLLLLFSLITSTVKCPRAVLGPI